MRQPGADAEAFRSGSFTELPFSPLVPRALDGVAGYGRVAFDVAVAAVDPIDMLVFFRGVLLDAEGVPGTTGGREERRNSPRQPPLSPRRKPFKGCCLAMVSAIESFDTGSSPSESCC